MSRLLIDDRPMPSDRRTWLFAIGALSIVIGWECAGRGAWLGPMLPPLSVIMEATTNRRYELVLLRAIAATLPSIAAAFTIGVVGAVIVALVECVLPWLRSVLQRAVLFVSTLPLIALAPVLVSILGVAKVPVAIGALLAFFPTFVAASSGLDTSKPALLDLVASMGGRRIDEFRYIRLPGALLMIADGLRVSATAAVFGVLFGEWFGTDRGLGVMLVTTMQNYQIQLLWLAALTATALTVVAIAVFAGLGALVARRFG